MTVFQWVENGRRAAMLEPYRRWTRFGVVEVPAGFVTDFASVPRALWPLVPKIGPYNMAAVVHDWLYREHPRGWTRAQADAVFYDLMIEDGVSKLRAATMYAAVRAGAWWAWRRNG